MRVMLITNPFATFTTPEGRDALVNTLDSRYHVDVEHTTHRGHAGELGARAAAEGYDAVVVHGGDGSVNETANGILGSPDSLPRDPSALPALGVVPGGSANVFARALGIDRDPLRATAQLMSILDRRQRRSISLGHTLNRWFLFNAGMGMDAIVVRRMEELRHRGKKATAGRYLRTTVGSFLKPSIDSPTFTVEVPGHEPVDGVRFGFVSNTGPWTYLGTREIRTNPGTDFDHGLGIFAATSVSVPRNIVLGSRLLAGTEPKARHLYRNDDVDWVRFTSPEPADVQMDGDYLGLFDKMEFGYRRAVLDVVAPPKAD
ncbi:diacylglycerol/lipid kinase family protein [Gordonia neofelifaecis]|uniref:Diacylglycerol kinase catalytic region n=1 Tax=Gordonia neofelifaecis NRRL B-59395 TaxID=644548 RepID=F1YJJ7_9ACTN|nr:diacylglycerol kinase family protein [Gordonia neofelifaecis]EGD55230.1 diacylglycerol kinase catalytic region [Gordonia neofelifaecis NRRL B-59395]